MRYTIPLALAACVLAAGGGWYLAKRGSAPPPISPQTVEQPGTRGPAVQSSRPGYAPMLSEAEEAAKDAEERKASQDGAKAVIDSGRRLLQQRFDSEQPDAAWARRKEAELESRVIDPQMDAINAIPTSFKVECRSATCRIVADFASRSAAEDWLTLYLTTNGGLLKQASFDQAQQPDGTVRMQILGNAR